MRSAGGNHVAAEAEKFGRRIGPGNVRTVSC